MKKNDAEIYLTDETREIVAAYLAKRQKAKKPIMKDKAPYEYDARKPKK